LKEDSKRVLDKIAKYMEEVPEISFKIEGHTDNRDRDEFNLLLSQKRADAVMKYLMRKKIKRERLSFEGYGESRPKYSNTTPEGRQLNRRVEIKPKNELDINPLKNQTNEGVNKTGFYTVRKGDTIYSIAKKYDLSIEKLKMLNNLKSDGLKIGQKLKIEQKK